MTKKHLNKKPLAAAIEFAGFEDWFQIFEAGTHVDKNGNQKTWTVENLDSVVANHSTDDPVPYVIGHPKDNDPAYGWTKGGIKREGNILFAKGPATVPEFEQAVKDELFPNRSVSLEPDGNGGWKLRHIGFLGAKMPAVAGQPRLNFSSADDAAVYEFAYADDVYPIKNVLRSLTEMFTRFRERIIEKDGIEEADKVVPSWEREHLDRQIDRIGEEVSDNPLYQSPNHTTVIEHSNHDEGLNVEPTEKEIQLQADLDAANAEKDKLIKRQAAQAFSTCRDKAQLTVNQLLTDGKLLPAQVQGEGLANFMAHLANDDDNTFEFAASDAEEPTKMSPAEFFEQFLSSLNVQVVTGGRDDDEPIQHSYSTPDGSGVEPSRLDLHEQALQYQRNHEGVTYEQAAIAVEKGEK